MQIAKSKKFWVSLLGTLGAVGAAVEGLPENAQIAVIVGTVVYVLGQGLADFGKEAQK